MNVNMANMAAMGPAAVGTPIMMNNGGVVTQGTPRPMQPNDGNRAQLNTYIYDYFIRNGMFDCARALLNCDTPPKVQKDGTRRDENGNLLGNGLGDDPMDTDSKDDIDAKRPDDLPAPLDNLFLYEWFCIFWDIGNAQKGKSSSPQITQYVQHTQQQSRMRQEHQQNILRQMNPNFASQQYQQQMMRNMNGAMAMKSGNTLPRTAMANNNPQAIQMLQQKPGGQMQQNPSEMDGNRARPASPGSADNAPSPSKRPRLEGAGFNPNQGGMVMPNGRPVAQGMPGQPQHQLSQMPNKPGPNAAGPQGQGSPMVPQGPDGPNIGAFYNAGEMAPGNVRPGPGNGQAAGGSNHALQDYQMQLMLLEQQNKKRLMMARQEQDMGQMPRADGPGGPGGPGGPPAGPNAQGFPGASPPGGRPGASPNPTDQMKRVNQQMNNPANMGSPLPADGGAAAARNSPSNAMNFMGNLADGQPAPFMMGPNQMNGMRPPPNQAFNGQMTPQQHQMMAAAARQQQGQAQGGPGIQWQGGPNGQMPPGAPQPPVQGTPQQRAMPPPSAPAAAANNANSRNTTSSPQTSTAAPPTPQQGNKAAPKKKNDKSAKSKTASQKKSNPNLGAGATPAADGAPEQEPTPATPITPATATSFSKAQNAGGVVVNGQAPAQPPTAPAPAVPPAHADNAQNGGFAMDSGPGLDFSSMDFAPISSGDVLNDFDFDSFLHDGTGGDDGSFDFSNSAFNMEGGEIGAE